MENKKNGKRFAVYLYSEEQEELERAKTILGVRTNSDTFRAAIKIIAKSEI